MIRLCRATFWAAATFALVMALLPQPPQLPGSPSDKVLHVLAFATLGVLALMAYRSTQWLHLLLGLSVFGAVIEFLQAIPALHRDSDPTDWIADTVAAAVAMIVTRWCLPSGIER